MLFRVRGTGRGESVSTGTDGTHFVREPVDEKLTGAATNRSPHLPRGRVLCLALQQVSRDEKRPTHRAPARELEFESVGGT